MADLHKEKTESQKNLKLWTAGKGLRTEKLSSNIKKEGDAIEATRTTFLGEDGRFFGEPFVTSGFLSMRMRVTRGVFEEC